MRMENDPPPLGGLISSAWTTGGWLPRGHFTPPVPTDYLGVLPSKANCTEHFISQPLDHFSFDRADRQFDQRYFVCAQESSGWVANGPVFFYVGNEANVELYVNATGLMWENAASFNALIVFAEHRYYGASLPIPADATHAHLTHEQALADYATLIYALRTGSERLPASAASSAFVAFGGSYGGSMAAWLRMKYPAAVAGAIAASAPLLAFRGQAAPTWDSESYYRVVSKTALFYSASCASSVRAIFPAIDAAGTTASGRAMLQREFRLCETPSAATVSMLRYFVRDGFDSLAMGNYPWPSTYIAGTAAAPMPAYPFGVACAKLDAAPRPNRSSGTASGAAAFAAMREALAVLYNVSGKAKCYALPAYPTPEVPAAPIDGLWDWQWCTEELPDSFWFSTDGVRDIFWPNKFNATLIATHCREFWNVAPRSKWIAAEYGGRSLGAGHSNIVFSSGSFDGWSSGGVATNLSSSMTAILIEEGAHHLDLMFSHKDDPPSVIAARKFELEQVKKWIEQHAKEPVAMSWGDLL